MRLQSIDALRGLAITLVLFRHFEIVKVVGEIGWSGVDLFFVISGFLVSGLMFGEYKNTGRLMPWRFLIRRGLKIYPPFYLLILFTIAKAIAVNLLGVDGNRSFTLRGLLSELFFVQNYFSRLWTHTWSLAVEEHFYLLLLVLVLFLISKKKLENGALPYIAGIVAVSCLIMRAINYSRNPFDPDTHMIYTHLRLDSLFFGVLISYFYHFRQQDYQLFVGAYKGIILILGVLCLSCLFVFPINSFFMNTAGLSLIYLGYGALLILCLQNEKHFRLQKNAWANLLLKPFAFVGYYSYSVYLWHLPVLIYLIQPFFSSPDGGAAFAAYFFLSVLCGIVFSKLVEKPVLRFRDRHFPQLSTANNHQTGKP